MISCLIYAMTLAFGKQKLRDVFQRNCMMKLQKMVTHSLQFVTGQILIACNLMSHILLNIAQTRTKAVIRKIIFSVMTVEPAYQKVVYIYLGVG